MKYKIVLLTSGLGSRLGGVTDYTNKSLVRLGRKPVLSYILDKYPEDVEIVVALGHYGEQVKDFLELVYPSRNFSFVWVDPFSGKGSSLVYSLLQTKNKINCPFIYHACDTLVPRGDIPEPKYNWLAGKRTEESAEYTSFVVSDGKVVRVNQKGEKDFDFAYIGLAGIFDYVKFFARAEELYQEQRSNQQLSDIDVSSSLIKDGTNYFYIEFPSWFDVGNTDKLKLARKFYETDVEILDKISENIFMIDDKVVKFFYDPEMVEKRVKRAKILEGFVPQIVGSKRNFYTYSYKKGKVLSSILNEQLMEEFLEWSRDRFWQLGREPNGFSSICLRFYFEKTKNRIEQFLRKYNIEDIEERINGLKVPKVFDILESIPSDWLCSVPPYRYHGDYILDNIIYTGNEFVLLDWRQDFGGNLEVGDIYYDLAKLNHSLTFNHAIVNKGNFKVSGNGGVKVDLLMSYNLQRCRKKLMDFLKKYQFDVEKVEVLTGIIWLNMSPLHNYPVDMFLYYFGRLNLYEALTKD